MSITTKQSYYIMLLTVFLLFCGLITAVVLGNSWLQSKSQTLRDGKLELLVIDEQQAAVNRAKKDIAEYEGIEAIANTIVPKDKDQARSIREINLLAAESGVQISSFSFQSSSLGSTKSVKTTTEGDTTASKPVSITQATPVKGITGVYEMGISVQSNSSIPVPYESFINFLELLENNRRTSQVDSITISPSPNNPETLTFQLGLSLFIKP